jgi:hypothetical protein
MRYICPYVLIQSFQIDIVGKPIKKHYQSDIVYQQTKFYIIKTIIIKQVS